MTAHPVQFESKPTECAPTANEHFSGDTCLGGDVDNSDKPEQVEGTVPRLTFWHE